MKIRMADHSTQLQFIPAGVGSGVTGKNWKNQKVERKTKAVTFTIGPYLPRLNREGGMGSPESRLCSMPTYFEH